MAALRRSCSANAAFFPVGSTSLWGMSTLPTKLMKMSISFVRLAPLTSAWQMRFFTDSFIMVGVNEEKSVFFLTRARNFSALMVSRAALCEISKRDFPIPRSRSLRWAQTIINKRPACAHFLHRVPRAQIDKEIAKAGQSSKN